MKKVVIIGGGFAGAYAARRLERDFDVTLIDTKDYFEFTPGILRTIVDTEHMNKIQVLHNDYLTTAHFCFGKVSHITSKEVLVGKKKYSYDYLIISSGSRYNSPIKEMNLVIATRAQELRKYASTLKSAQKVLIIGGGVVGVELAGEIASAYSNKEITLVHAKAALIERNPPRARRYAQEVLLKLGVKIIFNEKVIKRDKKSYVTTTGKVLETDVAFLCTGIVPNYEFLKEECSASLNERNLLVVNDFLQVKGFDHLFSAGDINSVLEEKTAQSAEKQAYVVVRNIYHLEQKEPLEKYDAKPKPMVISLGQFKGIFVYQNLVLTGLIPSLMKKVIEWKTMRRYRK